MGSYLVDVIFYTGDSDTISMDMSLGTIDGYCTGTAWFDAMELLKM
jgi:hypothetical protein